MYVDTVNEAENKIVYTCKKCQEQITDKLPEVQK